MPRTLTEPRRSPLLPGVDMHQWYRSAPRNAQDKETVRER